MCQPVRLVSSHFYLLIPLVLVLSLQFPLLLRRKPVAESLEITLTFWKLQAPLSSPAFTLHAYPVPDTVESEVGRASEYKLTSVLMV